MKANATPHSAMDLEMTENFLHPVPGRMAASSLRRQLAALLKRNILVKRRNLKHTLQEVLYPVYMIVVLALVHIFTQQNSIPPIPHYPAVPLTNSSTDASTLYAWPNSESVNRVMSHVIDLLPWPMTFEAFDSALEAERRYMALENSSAVFAGIGFAEVNAPRMNYSIRMSRRDIADTEVLYSTHDRCRSPNQKENCPANTYHHSGFLVLQRAIDTALRQESTNMIQLLPDVDLQQMPKTSWQPDIIFIQMLSSIYLVMAFSPIVSFLCVNLVSEKEKGYRESMRMMGMHNTALWLSWVITYGALVVVISLLSVLVAVAAQLFQPASAPLLFICLTLYGFTLIGFAHILAPIFRSAQVAGLVASLLSIVFAIAYMLVSLTRVAVTPDGPVSSIPAAGQWALCLLSPTALALAVDRGIFLDIFGNGMTFSNIGVGQFPIYGSVLMLIVDFLLYSLLAVYLDMIIPGDFGQHRAPWFFLMPSFWSRGKLSACPEMDLDKLDETQNEGGLENIEEISAELRNKNVIRMTNLRKVYHPSKGLRPEAEGTDGGRHEGPHMNVGDDEEEEKYPPSKEKKERTVAVDGISLDIYEGQITAILGHNGAGKTTLFNMLTGLTPVTSGSASIYGLDATSPDDQARIRQMTGVCPQGNVLFDDLSCREHLVFYANLKGVPRDDIESQTLETLKNVYLHEQSDTKSKALSGGQKRKLSVGIALIGDPKVIFLDEPTSGMDPYSRRHLWSFLKASRANRVILLTTHFMDEADILADRKVFMSQGKLKCVGSSLYLKNRFGLGYHMAIVREPSCDIEPITELVQSHVTTAELARCQNQEAIYTLPLNAVDKFADLFSSVERQIATKDNSLGIHSFGITMTTLEEVFLKIGVEEEEEENSSTSDNHHRHHHDNDDVQLPLMHDDQTLSPTSVFWLRLRALMLVRLLIVRRRLPIIIGLPILFIVLAAFIQKFATKPAPNLLLPPLSFTPSLYARTAENPRNPEFIYAPANGSLHVADFISTIRSHGVSVSELLEGDLLTQSPHFIGMVIRNVSLAGQQQSSCAVSLLYNDTAVHSLPVIVNLMSNTLLRLLEPSNSSTIALSSHPWPVGAHQMGAHFNGGLLGSVTLISVALVAMPSVFGAAFVKDREVKARALLRISGVTINMYWLSTIIVDLAQYMFICLVCLIILLAFQVKAIMTAGAVICILLLYITYAPVLLISAYIVSFAYNKHETAHSFLPLTFIFASFLSFMPVFMLDTFQHEDSATTLHIIFTVLNPAYAISGAFYYIERLYNKADLISDSDPVISVAEYFRWENNIVIIFIACVIQAGLFYFLMRFLEIRCSGGAADWRDTCLCHRSTSAIADQSECEVTADVVDQSDSDVRAERSRVMKWDDMQPQPAVLVRNLRKEYVTGSGKCKRKKDRVGVKVAVGNNSFVVEAGEVFGLLGPNGAGKSTTLNMIIAEEAATSGKVYVSGQDVTSNLSPVFSMIGYCPQHDALWEDVTLRQHLICYAAVQGMSPHNTDALIGYYIKAMQLSEHADKPAKALSGGTKRKLSYIISMLGKPATVLMDEPSTGMDPKSKRFLWSLIHRSFSNQQRGAILTTHYMEEADTLCTRIAIMVNGNMQCIGTSQHLKNKFGSGYVLEVKLSPVGDTQQAMTALRSFVADIFAGAAEEAECFGERVTYKIAQDNIVSLSHAFKSLEEVRSSLGIEEYSLSQCTLEQVFIQFAKQQEAVKTKAISSPRSSSLRNSVV